ncbi:tetratricopeptide repeat protein, partial [Laribacter hongkongensis]|uniref:tetratricopeptide repeat protein n=1 Tax=Laribacter hongkongensis TaxID=168471 RepID=UPI00054F4AE2
QRQDFDRAEAMYRKALELAPDDANTTCNYSGFCLIVNNTPALNLVPSLVKRVIELSAPQASQVIAEALLYGQLHSELKNKQQSYYLGQLKSLLSMNFKRGNWDFSSIFSAVMPKIPQERHDLYKAIGDAILDANAVISLDEFQLWKETFPSDPFESNINNQD